jgi:hypothetical protein
MNEIIHNQTPDFSSVANVPFFDSINQNTKQKEKQTWKSKSKLARKSIAKNITPDTLQEKLTEVKKNKVQEIKKPKHTLAAVNRKIFKYIKRYNRNISTSISKKITPIINSRAGKMAERGGYLLGKMVKGVAWSGPRKLKKLASALPTTIKRAGLFGTVLLGATAMFGIGMMKGAMNQSRDIVYERYMQDQAIGKNMLNNTRLGVSAGTSRMQTYGHTTGLSNSLSRTRHG